jgi:hypothetical protein
VIGIAVPKSNSGYDPDLKAGKHREATNDRRADYVLQAVFDETDFVSDCFFEPFEDRPLASQRAVSAIDQTTTSRFRIA